MTSHIKKIALLFAVLFTSAEAQADLCVGGNCGGGGGITTTTVGSLPPAGSPNPYRVTDGASEDDCTTGGGGSMVLCGWTGAAWVAFGDGSSPGTGGATNTIAGDTGGAATGANVTIAGGTNASTVRSGDTITINATDTNTNAATICGNGLFLNGDGSCDAMVTDTNAGTECAAGEYLDGNGSCLPIPSNTNASTICTGSEVLEGSGACVANAGGGGGTVDSLRGSAGGSATTGADLVITGTGTVTVTSDGASGITIAGSGGGTGATGSSGGYTYPLLATDDLSVGGTDDTAPFHFDESAGVLNLNLPGSTIDLTAAADTGQSMGIKEGSNDGTGTFQFAVSDDGISDVAHTCTISGDGSFTGTCPGVPARNIEIALADDTACSTFNAAMDNLMDVSDSSVGEVFVRVHHDGVDDVSIQLNDFVDLANPADTNNVVYQNCFAMLPHNGASAYPNVWGADGRANLSTTSRAIHVHFDEVVLNVDASGSATDVGQCVLDIGAGWQSGVPYGSTSVNTQISGSMSVVYTDGTTLSDSNDQRLTEGYDPAGAHRWRGTGTSVGLCANRATYTDMKDFKFFVQNQDENDIMASFANVWGLHAPYVSGRAFNRGTGLQVDSVINVATPFTGELRKFDYGLVLGDPYNYGAVPGMGTGCAADTDTIDNDGDGLTDAADTDGGECDLDNGGRNVRGFKIENLIMEGNRYANIISNRFGDRNVIHSLHNESNGDPYVNGSTQLGVGFCDAGAWADADEYTPFTIDDQMECLRQFDVVSVSHSGGFCVVTIDDENGGVGALDAGDGLILRFTEDPDLNVWGAGNELNLTAVVDNGTTWDLTTDVADTDCTVATYNSDHAIASIVVNADTTPVYGDGSNFTPTGVGGLGYPNANDDGTLIFTGLMTGTGTNLDTLGSPSVAIGPAFTDSRSAGGVNGRRISKVLFRNGIQLGDGTGNYDGFAFAFHPDNMADTRSGWTRGNSLRQFNWVIDTSDSYLTGEAKFPVRYDGWVDHREESFYKFVHGESDTDNDHADSARASSTDSCLAIGSEVRGTMETVAADSDDCNDPVVESINAINEEFFITRAIYQVKEAYGDNESCGFGIAIAGDVDGTNVYQAEIDMPPANDITYGIGDREIFDLDIHMNEEAVINIDLNSFVVPMFRGQYDPVSGGGTLSCGVAADAGGIVDIRGFRFNPSR